ncbi:MAG: magnesium transporter [Geminicoccaceae bacterium]|nr:MAG: magnesium transporter [Geminicoccaceae bacterium]
MSTAIHVNALRAFLDKDDQDSARVALQAQHPADLANDMGAFTPPEAAKLVMLVPDAKRAEVFGYLPPEFQTGIARVLPRGDLAKIITAMSHDERADLFKRLSDAQKSDLLPALAQAEREDIRKLAAYKEGTAGALMTSDYATLGPDLTVMEAIDRLRQEAPDAETIYDAFVVDEERRLVGVISLRDLILARADRRVADVMRRAFQAARVEDDDQFVARKIQEYDLRALPILNGGDKLVGIVTQDDAMDVQVEDASELMYQKAGIADIHLRGEHHLDTIRSEKLTSGTIWYPIRVRLAFLLVTLAGGLLVGTLIDAFEEVLMAVVAVAVFIPLIMDMGGNVGTQSTTIFARGYALGHIQLDRFGSYLRREATVGLVMGVIIGITAGVIAYYWQGLPNDIPQLGIAVGVALFTSVTLACALGFLLPYAMVKIGVDHAPGADPFITTIKDFSGLAVYFLLVAYLLGVDI